MARVDSVVVGHFDAGRAEAWASLVRKTGRKAQVFTKGPEVLRYLRRAKPGALLVDALLHELSGLEVARRIKWSRANGPAPRVGVVMDRGDGYTRGRARYCGVDAILYHPVHEADVRSFLRARPEKKRLASRAARIQGRQQDLASFVTPAGEADLTATAGATIDPRTGLFNTRAIRARLEEEFHKSLRYGDPLSLLVVEVADLARLAIQHGNAFKDAVLGELSGVVLLQSRDTDSPGRLGPGRILLVLPATGPIGAKELARRVVTEFSRRKLTAGRKRVPVRIAVGGAAFPDERVGDGEALLEKTMRALGRARRARTNPPIVLSLTGR